MADKVRTFDHGGWALPWKVAQAAGDFAAEGLEVEIIDWDASAEVQTTGTADLTTSDKEKKFCDGQLDVYGACEWGLIKRVSDLGAGKIVGMRRNMGMPMKLFVPPTSDATSPADLAAKPIAINENSGSHYVAIEVLERYMPKDKISLVHIGQPFARYEALINGTVGGAFVLEPYSTLAEIQGARCLSSYAGRGGLVANKNMTPEIYERFRRAVERAADRINKDPETYKHMLVDQLTWTSVSPELVEQVRQRIEMPKYQAPESYSEEAFQECYDWMRDRDLIKDGIGYRDIV